MGLPFYPTPLKYQGDLKTQDLWFVAWGHYNSATPSGEGEGVGLLFYFFLAWFSFTWKGMNEEAWSSHHLNAHFLPSSIEDNTDPVCCIPHGYKVYDNAKSKENKIWHQFYSINGVQCTYMLVCPTSAIGTN